MSVHALRPAESWLPRALRFVDELDELTDGWDGDRAPAPTAAATTTARAVLRWAHDEGTAEPVLDLESDGTITLDFPDQQVLGTVRIDPDAVVSYPIPGSPQSVTLDFSPAALAQKLRAA